jgi:hypothetical protein
MHDSEKTDICFIVSQFMSVIMVLLYNFSQYLAENTEKRKGC